MTGPVPQPADREAHKVNESVPYKMPDRECICPKPVPEGVLSWYCPLHGMMIVRKSPVPVDGAPELDELRTILAGIDGDEGDGEGWWETSTGMDFGADKLAEVLTWGQRALGLPVTDNHVHRWTDYRYQMTGREFRYSCRCGAETNDVNH